MKMSRTEAIEYVAGRVRRRPRQYRYRAEFLFDGIPLRGRRVLDVGCGPGAYALWAAIHGAEYVLGIEPEADGSTGGSLSVFSGAAEALGVQDCTFANSATWEELEIPERPFDVVVMYNVINHLYEDLVREVHLRPSAADEYVGHLEKLGPLTAPGSHLIIADCGRENFWNSIGRRSPLAPTIDWDIHQQPEVWAELLGRIGFSVFDLRWSPWWPLGRLTANRAFQYMTASHFVLRLVKN
jgi:SAM-dependent methyltransferase